MIKKEEVIESLRMVAKAISEYDEYSTFPGIYAFLLNDNSTLMVFGPPNSVLYVGTAKESLTDRDLGNHFNNNSTWQSTLRRSIGSILKAELDLKVFSRNGINNTREITNFGFNFKGDASVTEWMNNSLVVGYWEEKNKITYTQLRELEKQVIEV